MLELSYNSGQSTESGATPPFQTRIRYFMLQGKVETTGPASQGPHPGAGPGYPAVAKLAGRCRRSPSVGLVRAQILFARKTDPGRGAMGGKLGLCGRTSWAARRWPSGGAPSTPLVGVLYNWWAGPAQLESSPESPGRGCSTNWRPLGYTGASFSRQDALDAVQEEISCRCKCVGAVRKKKRRSIMVGSPGDGGRRALLAGARPAFRIVGRDLGNCRQPRFDGGWPDSTYTKRVARFRAFSGGGQRQMSRVYRAATIRCGDTHPRRAGNGSRDTALSGRRHTNKTCRPAFLDRKRVGSLVSRLPGLAGVR